MGNDEHLSFRGDLHTAQMRDMHAVHATHRFPIQECAAQPRTAHTSYRQGTVLTPVRDVMHSSMQPQVLVCSVHPMPVALRRLRYRLVAAHNR